VTDGTPISRQRLLVAAFGVAVPLAVTPLRPWRLLVRIEGRGSIPQRFVALMADRDTARAVGLEYLQAPKAERSANALATALAHDLQYQRHDVRNATDAELRGLISVRITRDFEEERIVELRGWILSLTEARLCGLAAVTPARS